MFISKKSIVITPYLFAIYPIIFLYSHNLHEVEFYQILFPSAIALIVTFLLVKSSLMIFGDIQKAGIFVVLFLIIFFLYDNFYDFIKGWQIGSLELGRNIYLLSILGIVITSYAYIIKKTQRNLYNFTKILNIIAFLLILINCINIGVYNFRTINDLETGKSVVKEKLNERFTKAGAINDSTILRDIYYIILDGYPSSNVLKEYYNYDNHEFIDYLTKRGFYVASKSRSNYPSATFLSLASSLNMEYINYLTEIVGEGATAKDRDVPYQMIKNNKVINLLKSIGYKFIHFSSSWGATNDNVYADLNLQGPFDLFRNEFSSEFFLVLTQSTVLREVFNRLNYTGGRRDKILFTFDQLSKVYKIKGPKFTFAHIVAPHPPYYFGLNGEQPPEIKQELYGNIWLQKQPYLNQLIYVNCRVKMLINEILSNSDIPPIIVFQGDHGTSSSWSEDPEISKVINSLEGVTDKLLRERLNILNAYYLPSGGRNLLYDTITPVNTFRLIFNYYFDAGYEILEDKNYYSNWDHPYIFMDVTDRGRY